MNFSSLFRHSSGDRRKKPPSPGQMEYNSPHGSPQQQQQQQEKRRWGSSRKPRTPKPERSNAHSNIKYEARRPSSDSHSYYYDSPRSGGTETPRTRSLDLPQPSSGAYRNKTSFRIQGVGESEIEDLFSSIGISGPDEFAVPVADWNARKARCCSDVLPRPTAFESAAEVPTRDAFLTRDALASTAESPSPSPSRCSPSHVPAAAVPVNSASSRDAVDGEGRRIRRPDDPQLDLSFGIRSCSTATVEADTAATSTSRFAFSTERVSRGIRGVRPPILTPPPSMSRPTNLDSTVSPWDMLRSFAPRHDDSDEQGDFHLPERAGASPCSDDGEGTPLQENGASPHVAGGFTEQVTVSGLVSQPSDEITTTFNSFTTVDDDSSSTTTEGAYGISPNGRFKRNIHGWTMGRELGRGSFGIVYEAINHDGFFFAVKEVSLLNESERDEQQSIMQLEQEITLLSQFEHENIVQYLGTEKAENKLYIFLELVTRGSLASLYHKYDLRDSQVSAYTRQILHGLKYLHDQNVVHRDIKCANILVEANGSVKLADFGLAKQIKKTDKLKSCKGSVYWMAPEVANPVKEYGWPADIWSLGCTVLEMLTRNPPYNVEWIHAFYMINQGELPEIPESLSSDARDFIQKCLQVDPDCRPDASVLLQHPFVRRQVPSWGNDYSHGRRT